jgi:hypothetical protein
MFTDSPGGNPDSGQVTSFQKTDPVPKVVGGGVDWYQAFRDWQYFRTCGNLGANAKARLQAGLLPDTLRRTNSE